MTTLPDRIPLGMVTRDFRDGVSTADRVRSVQDLPSRLLLGQLDEASFATTEDGWRARYRGEATEIDLTWGRNGLSVRQQWHGHEAITDIGDGTFAKLVQAGFCHLEWLRDLPTVLAPALNVFVETGAGGPPMACYYPDGLMLTLLLPVALERLDVCPVLMGHLDEEPRILAPVLAELQLGWSVVNYIEGGSPHVNSPPDAVDEYTLNVLGLPTLEPAQVDTRGDGVRALTVRRRHFQLVMQAFLCDLPQVLIQLARHGLLARRPDPGEPHPERYPDSPEYSAVVLPAAMGLLVEQLVFFDDARTRRVVYPGPIRGIEQELPPVDEAASSAVRQIEDVQTLIRGLFREAEGNDEE
jgi:hypothetical protein